MITVNEVGELSHSPAPSYVSSIDLSAFILKCSVSEAICVYLVSPCSVTSFLKTDLLPILLCLYCYVTNVVTETKKTQHGKQQISSQTKTLSRCKVPAETRIWTRSHVTTY